MNIHGTIFIYSEGSPCQTAGNEHPESCAKYYARLSEIFPNITFKIFFKNMRIDPAGINQKRLEKIMDFISEYYKEETEIKKEVEYLINEAIEKGRTPPAPFIGMTNNYFRLMPKSVPTNLRKRPIHETGTAAGASVSAAFRTATEMPEEQEEMDLEFNSQAYNKQSKIPQWKKCALSENKREFIGFINKWVNSIADIMVNLNIKNLLFNSAFSRERVEYHVIEESRVHS
jgi:hypothetical protein